jgi:hypothetical protein
MNPRLIQGRSAGRAVFGSILAFLVFGGLTAPAQEYRATILGTITDQGGSVVPGAKVRAVNVTTDVRSSTESNGEGNYIIPFLLPGEYRVIVEQTGFRMTDRGPITLRVGDRTRIDLTLQVGTLSDRVEVTAAAPLLDSASADRGTVTGAQMMAVLPGKARNPWEFVSLSAGLLDTNNPIYPRPQDGSLSYSMNGGRTSFNNEVLMDGQPRDIGWRAVPQEAVEEVKAVTSTYDAQYGHTSGGIISMAVKSGTNQPHGAAYEYMSRTPLNANSFANNANHTVRPFSKVDQFGVELDGPVYIPHVYNGKSRTFFTFSMEKWRQFQPVGVVTTVPTALEHTGDFSQSFTSSGAPYTIYDPQTLQPNPNFNAAQPITLSNLQYLRTPFPNNVVPSTRFNPVGVNILKLLPMPNQTGNAVTHANNFFNSNGNSQQDHFGDVVARIDHNFNDKWKMYGRYDNNIREVPNINGNKGWGTVLDSPYMYHWNQQSGLVDFVGILTPSTILDVKAGGTYFSTVIRPFDTFDQVSQLGMPQSLISQLDLGGTRWPGFSFQNYTGNSSGDSFTPWALRGFKSVQAGIVRTQAAHTFHIGMEYRSRYYGYRPTSGTAGSYGFSRSWTSSNPNVDNASTGNAIASLLLGDMSSATISHNVFPTYTWYSPGVYFQDDWRVTRRLTVNWGFRWDYESPIVERHDRQIRGFDFSSPSPIQVPGMALTGGLLFAGVNGPRGAFSPDKNDWQPRLGFAYRALEKKPLVFRGGIGRFFLPTSPDGTGEAGASTPWGATTTGVTSTSGFLPAATIDNPFPNGLVAGPGASQGLATLAGTSITVNNLARHTPEMWQYSAGVQYELTTGLLLEGVYSGSNTRWLPVSESLQFTSLAQLALGQPYLNAAVPNPFYGVLPATTSLGAQPTIGRGRLLLPYPQFAGLTTTNNSFGYSWYNSGQFRVEYRLKHGVSFQIGYTISKTMEAVSLLNPQDLSLLREKAAFDRPQRLVTTVSYHLPVGPNTSILNRGLISHLVGGWDLTMTGIAQSGVPISLSNGNYVLTGNPALASGQSYSHWFDTSSSLWYGPLPAGSLRQIPLVSPNLRTPVSPQFDIGITRDFVLHENHRLQFRALAYNATNTPLFNGPNTDPTSPLFGVVTLTQTNMPREIDLGLRYRF